MSDHLKFSMSPERAAYYGKMIRRDAENDVGGANDLIEELLNLFNNKNASTIAVALAAALALVDKTIEEDGSTGAAVRNISIADVVKSGVPIYKERVTLLDLKERLN